MKNAIGCLLLAFASLTGAMARSQSDIPPELAGGTAREPRTDCTVGLFASPETFLAITMSKAQARYSFSDGREGAVDDNPAIECAAPQGVLVDGVLFAHQPIRVTEARFESDGATLVGQLLEPLGAEPETPLVVFAHGSEERGWIGQARDPYQMVGRGVSVFVYDKRGTGRSGGAYSQNFPQLADDLVAASRTAKRIAAGRYGRFGLIGLSQGGWIAPLAAERARADFLFIGYGLVVDILEEDSAQVALELREAGYDADVLAKAKSLTDVTARLAVSNYQDGLDDLDRLRAAYSPEPWFSKIKGGFSGVILSLPTEELRAKGIPMFDRLNIDWSLKPIDVMRKVTAPQLWALAGADREAPVDTTLARLQTLRAEGRDIRIRLFPNTDHGVWLFEEAADRSRQYTRIADGYFDLMADWAKGDLKTTYGNSLGL
ncbi:MAG: alpha/beta fold hydrolase [Pseudomonadota bacterium]